MAEETIPTWGFHKTKEAQIFNLKDSESLPEGYFTHPALVPGSKAEKKHKEDADREGAPVVLK